MDWWGTTPIAHAMNSSEAAFPAVEIVHMIGIVFLVGTAALVDFRLLGWRLAHAPVWEIASDLAPWTTAGLVLVLITGPLLLSTDPDRYYNAYQFRFKMACLFLALAFDFAVGRRVRTENSSATLGLQRFTGLVSLVLWSCVVLGGRAIGVLFIAK
jgi:hypothetical protein